MNGNVFAVLVILTTAVTIPAQKRNAIRDMREDMDIPRQIEKQKTAMRDLMRLNFAVDFYVGSHEKAPGDDFYTAVKPWFAANHLPLPPIIDPWGNPYLYRRSKENPEGYALACSGRDGKFAGWDRLTRQIPSIPKNFFNHVT